jgi:hypothetical protein
MVFKILAQMIFHLFRRGRGVFKILFVVDDFFRLFTMTILIPLFFNWIGFGQFLVTFGLILGLVIDVHDFMSQAGMVKLQK